VLARSAAAKRGNSTQAKLETVVVGYPIRTVISAEVFHPINLVVNRHRAVERAVGDDALNREQWQPILEQVANANIP
jgi:hypothetical protein